MAVSNSRNHVRLYYVNEDWSTGDEINAFNSASITKDGDSQLVNDASLSTATPIRNGYVRFFLEQVSASQQSRSALGTFLVQTTRRQINQAVTDYTVECYSVLQPAADKLLPIGWSIMQGDDPVLRAGQLLGEVLKAPVEITDSEFRTASMIVAENGETYLSMAKFLLDSVGWHINISGDGSVSLSGNSTEPSATFDLHANDVLYAGLAEELDSYEIPNILRVTDGKGNYAEVRNEEAILSDGREKWKSESLTLVDGENLVARAYQRLDELSNVNQKLSYQRDFDDGINVHDLVKVCLPEFEINNLYRIKTQTVNMSVSGVTVNETAILESEVV